MSALLAEPIIEALRAEASSELLVVTADPFFAQALQAEGGSFRCVDVFTWASEYVGVPKPTAIDLYEAYKKALKQVGPEIEGDILETWEAAQRLARDWEEVYLGTLRFSDAEKYWKALAESRQLQEFFQLYPKGQEPAWLSLLPLPHRRSPYLGDFWKKLQEFLEAYQRHLRHHKKAFSEKALQRIYEGLAEKRYKKDLPPVFFVHLYASYPVMEAILKEAPTVGWTVGGWEVQPLQDTLPEIWAGYPLPSVAATAPTSSRPITIHLRPTLVEVLTDAAEAIKDYLHQHPEAKLAIWCEGEAATLLRYFLQQVDSALEPQLSPAEGTLWETTQLGAALQSFLLQGLRKGWPHWPKIEELIPQATESSPAEKYARSLYDLVQRDGKATDSTAWQLLFSLLQRESPLAEGAFGKQVRAYIGRLSQLAGGQYDALFLVAPPAEPLGSWERPSFWLPSLRNQFFPRAKHHQLCWRLMSILLWGSREIFLWRQSAQEYQTPIEELLRHAEPLGLGKAFCMRPGLPAPSFSLPQPTPLEMAPSAPSPPSFLSPSAVSQLFVCPRRFYWQQQLSDLPPTDAVQLGRYLHTLVETTFQRKQGKPLPLRRLGYILSWRRWYYRLGRIHRYPERGKEPLRWERKYRFLRAFLARSTEAVGSGLYNLLQGDSAQIASPQRIPLRIWAKAPGRYRFRSEVPVRSIVGSVLVTGRMDLLIETLPFSAAEPVEQILVDFKPSVRELPSTPQFLEEMTLDWEAQQRGFSSPKGFLAEAFQLLSYAYFLQQGGERLDQAALISLWWRPKPKRSAFSLPTPTADPKLPVLLQVYDAQVLEGAAGSLERIWEQLALKIPETLPKGTSEFPQTADHNLCGSCSYALLCDRLSSYS